MKRAMCFLLAAVSLSVLAGAAGADDERETKPRFKGVELYSWKDKGGNWVYVLMSGTNRLKTEDEVKKSADRLNGTDPLKKALGRLASGEHVSWVHRIKGFEFPPEETQKTIQKAAKEAGVDLYVQPKE